MHIEKRISGKKTKYYLAHAVRMGRNVRKIRVYLGSDKNEAEKKKHYAEKIIRERLKAYKEITDPFRNILNQKEMEEIEALEAKGAVKIKHLSDDDWKRFTKDFAYDTNAIEGSTVSPEEVKGMLDRGQWPRDRQKWEISETYGVSDAIELIRNTREHISIPLIKELHKVVFMNSKPFAGEFRKKGQEVGVVDGYGNIVHRGAPSSSVPGLLKELVQWYDKNKGKYPPILLAAIIHNQFENIHPFADGNGRVGRLLLNNILIKHNKPPVNIEMENRGEYYAAIREYEHGGNIRPTIELILKEYRSFARAAKKPGKQKR